METGVSVQNQIRLANIVDPVETARYEPSHLDLHCFAQVSLLVCQVESVLKDYRNRCIVNKVQV